VRERYSKRRAGKGEPHAVILWCQLVHLFMGLYVQSRVTAAAATAAGEVIVENERGARERC